MADDERAAKAARAKALLKKRQQQKKNGTAPSSSGTHSPSATISRTSTPAPHVRDSGSVSNDTGALASPLAAPDAASESAAASSQPKPELVESLSPQSKSAKGPPQEEEESSRLLQDQRQTIALLVSEKTALTEALERLEGADSRLQNNEAELEGKLQELERLQANLLRIEEERNASSARTQELEAQNTTLTTKLREQERELHTNRSETDKLRSQLQKSERRTRELEEQIQNDDRVDVLETKIKNTQDRAEEVAFQLSKLKQTYDKLKAEHEGLQNEFQRKITTEQELKRQVADLEKSLRSFDDKLTTLSSERDALAIANTSTVAELQSSRTSVVELESKFSQVSADLAAATRQLDGSQAELRLALRRAEDAETAQHDLQEEGTGLMRSLDEMRPKIVELTGAKLELMEKLEQLTTSLNQRDGTISELESQLESAHTSADEARQECERLEKEQEKEKSTAETGQAELQKAYSEMQARLDDALAATREIEADRGKQRQAAARLQEEVDRLQSTGQTLQEEINSLRSQVEEQEKAGDDEQRLLEELQQEVEALRVDVTTKEDEISRLRQAGPLSLSPLPSSKSLDDEVKGALTQQLELELSNAQSTIRSLESSLYDAEAKYLSLQKHVAAVEDEVSHIRSAAKTQRHAYPSRGSTSARRSDDLRRTSFASQGSNNTTRLRPTALIDENLPPATRHQRHISLAMLQARMYSEAEAATIHAAASKSSKPTAVGHVHSSTSSMDSSILSLRWPQFLDESHVFWCATCKGDLIVL